MRLIVGVLVAVTSLLTAPISSGDASFAGGGGTAEVDVGFVQRMLFDTSIADFIAGAGNRNGPDGLDHDTWFDWTTDLCWHRSSATPAAASTSPTPAAGTISGTATPSCWIDGTTLESTGTAMPASGSTPCSSPT